MGLIIDLLVTAAVILLMSYTMSSVQIKSIWTALGVALLIIISITLFTALLAWLLLVSESLNLLTIALFYYLEPVLSFIITAITLKQINKRVGGFNIKGSLPVLYMAVVVTVALAIAGWICDDEEDEYARVEEAAKTEMVYQQV